MGARRDDRDGRAEKQMARANVNDEVWFEFRTACLVEGEHVSDVLGRLVDQELQRRRRGAVGDRAARTPNRSGRKPPSVPRLFDDHDVP